jgi:hypothetical protein
MKTMGSEIKTRRQLGNLYRVNIFKPLAETVFSNHLGGKVGFEHFYDGLTDEEKDLFLGVASKYVYLVKNGDWRVELEDCEPVIDYFTNSFKLVSLFSLIESLSSEKYEDFYEWLQKQEDEIFPIPDQSKLKSLYEEYKKTYGSIRRCVRFFERLPPTRQIELRSGLMVRGKPVSEIRAVAEFLYNLRSKFVHQGEFVLEIASIPMMSSHKNAETMTDMPISTLLRAFEQGVLAYFGRIT